MAIKEHKEEKLERIANIATRWIGSTTSLIFHTIIFIIAFILPAVKITSFDKMLLILTTIVSLEAIYLAIFIQMSVNKNSEDIEEIQEDVEEIQEDIEEIQEDVEEIQEDVDEIQEDLDEIQEDVEEIQEGVEEIQEDLDEEDDDENVDTIKEVKVTETITKPAANSSISRADKIVHIQQLLSQLQKEITELKQ